MARTADRYLRKAVQTQNTFKKYNVGSYLRLSVDSGYTGSDSLENQRKLAKEYVSRYDGLNIIREYVDNGQTGTDFLRPAFNRMISDLKAGIINCVIVKDLSRFGREYIEAGNYIERVFPLLGVRFISIADQYDSDDANCSNELLLISLKNLMHEMYAKDISKKVGSTFLIKQEKGIFYRSVAVPYGYQMNESGTNYIVCGQTAPVVQEIFRQCRQGVSCYTICKWLCQNNIQTPGQYRQTGSVYRTQEDKLKTWHYSTVRRILGNPVYTGSIIKHKSEQSLFTGKKTSPVPEHKQIIIENNHKPIISRQMFEEVQKILNQTKEKRHSQPCGRQNIVFEKNIFQKKLFCGLCKANMARTGIYRLVNGEKEQYKIYKCSTHRNYSSLCSLGNISESVLCDILYITIQKHLSIIKGIQKYIEKYFFEENIKQIVQKRQKTINKRELSGQEYMQKYLQYAENYISQEEFLQYKNIYYARAEIYKQQEDMYIKEERKIKKFQAALQKLVPGWLQNAKESKELTAIMIEICIGRIEVFTDNRIEVKLKYQDCFL